MLSVCPSMTTAHPKADTLARHDPNSVRVSSVPERLTCCVPSVGMYNGECSLFYVSHAECVHIHKRHDRTPALRVFSTYVQRLECVPMTDDTRTAGAGVCTHVQRLRVPDTLQTLSAGRHVGVRAVVVRLVRLVRFVRTDTMPVQRHAVRFYVQRLTVHKPMTHTGWR